MAQVQNWESGTLQNRLKTEEEGRVWRTCSTGRKRPRKRERERCMCLQWVHTSASNCLTHLLLLLHFTTHMLTHLLSHNPKITNQEKEAATAKYKPSFAICFIGPYKCRKKIIYFIYFKNAETVMLFYFFYFLTNKWKHKTVIWQYVSVRTCKPKCSLLRSLSGKVK